MNKKVTVIQESEELNLKITAITAMRLGLVLERAAQELSGGDEQFLCDFAITWSQLFTMYGRAKSVELYMPDEDIRSYRSDLEAYSLGHFPDEAGKNGTPQHHSTTNGVTK